MTSPILLLRSIALSVLLIFICSCEGNSSVVSTSASESSTMPFPTIILGKDETSLYYANFSFGSPQQEQSLRIDIAQPYVWLLSGNESSGCNNSFNGCTSDNRYFIDNSTTSIDLNDGHVYQLDFMDGILMNGSAVMDTMNFTMLDMPSESDLPLVRSINSSSTAHLTENYLSLSNVSFINAIYASSLTKGALGLSGKITDEPMEIDSGKFDNSFFFLDMLTELGIVNSPSYSIWLGGDTISYNLTKLPSGVLANCGKLILGAVDPSLFSGPLRKFKMIPFMDRDTLAISNGYPILPMGAIYITSSSGKSQNVTAEEFAVPVLLDSRYSLSYLPTDAIIQIALQIGAIYVESLGKWLVACSIADLGVHLNFTFDDIEISIPLEDFLATTYDTQTSTTLHFSDGEDACFLTIVSKAVTGFNILGGAFLKNIYMAVDLDDESIAIAQARRVQVNTSASSASTILIPPLNTTRAVKAISSGNIPYAVSRNLSSSMTLYPQQAPSSTTNIPEQFTATLYSNGLISTGRSFYDTSRSTSSSKSSTTEFESFSISSAGNSSSTQAGNKKSNSASKRALPIAVDVPIMNKWSPLIFCLIGIFSLGIIL